ncbi:2OG-Fe(II) oxygenase [Sphingorhabdus sp.]|jgi:Rps23 Pro-64 3,4-dihydroxylase Tpa1-like proline 4-hydroxylase|uniref:2OG-Fe(II) oxygenase n=1 Tax=Sphingorhabdus sp. TaxID=1902408 RepID=UPI0037CC8BD5
MNTFEIAEHIVQRVEAECVAAKQEWMNPLSTRTRSFKIDNLLPENVAREVYDLFPKDSRLWFERRSFREQKKTFAKLQHLDALIENVTDAFHHESVVAAIGKITGFPDLEPDPELYAGGISMMQQGDFLNPHIDNSHDKLRNRYRRLNLLYYVTPDWDQHNGGNLELWDDAVHKPFQIDALFNRLVVMETNRTSWHSVNPVLVPASRCCVSNYYFSAASPSCTQYYHVTSFLGRPTQPLRRVIGRVDNKFRQFIAQRLKISRGGDLGRTK